MGSVLVKDGVKVGGKYVEGLDSICMCIYSGFGVDMFFFLYLDGGILIF